MSEIESMLSAKQARVLGSLMEKQMATPDYYPLTLNALVAACNQKSSRNPVMNLSPQQVVTIINELRRDGLATANTLGRADRFEQQLSRKLQLDNKQQAVICVLLLRGAHTVNEIKVNTSRMVEFADHDDIVATLESLIEQDQPLVVHIPRTHGQREDRYNHLLCGMPEVAATPQPERMPAAVDSDVESRLTSLEAEVAALKQQLRKLTNTQ